MLPARRVVKTQKMKKKNLSGESPQSTRNQVTEEYTIARTNMNGRVTRVAAIVYALAL